MTEYKQIHRSPILLEHPFSANWPIRAGAVILVDAGHQYVVAKRYSTDGVEDREWDHGTYFVHSEASTTIKTTQADALAEAVNFFQAQVKNL